jgi:hypothetical protein
MKRDKEFNNILNECLERLLVKGETIEQCLRRYPGQAAELKPLLKTALVTKRVSAIQPRADFKARARYQFRSALKEAAAKSRPPLGWFPRWATVATIALVLLLAGSSTVVAAGSSMPDSPLYPIKLAVEEARLALTFSPIGKARLCAELADRRVAEIIYMANKGDAQQVELITQRLDKRLLMLAVLALAQEEGEAPLMMMAPAPGEADFGKEGHAPANGRARLRMTLEYHAVNNTAALNAVLGEAPESARPALLRAIDVSAAGYQNALEALD